MATLPAATAPVKPAAAHNRRARPASYNGREFTGRTPHWPHTRKSQPSSQKSSVAHSSRRCSPLRDEHSAVDIVQDAMLKLTEKYSDKPAAELPMLFQRIVQNTIHDHFRRQKVRSTWTTLLSALGKGDEKDDDFDPLETLAAKSDSSAADDPARQLEQRQIIGVIEQALSGFRRVNGKRFCCVTGKNSTWRKPPQPWAVRRKRQNPLLARGSRIGRDAQGQRSVAMTPDDIFAKK